MFPAQVHGELPLGLYVRPGGSVSATVTFSVPRTPVEVTAISKETLLPGEAGVPPMMDLVTVIVGGEEKPSATEPQSSIVWTSATQAVLVMLLTPGGMGESTTTA
jgi:hypothetical protein